MTHSFLFDKKNISYSIVGEGDSLVLIHGFLETKNIWNDFIQTLSEHFHVLCIDLPGHGASDVLAPIHSMELMAEVLYEVLQQEKISKAVLVGHSMGGYVAATFAEKYPTYAQGLVFFHSHAAPDLEDAKKNRERMIHIVNEDKSNFVHQFIPNLFAEVNVANFQTQIEALQQSAAQMSGEAIVAALAGMRDRKGNLMFLSNTKCPVLFILGKQDSRMSHKQVAEQALIPKHAEMLLLDNVGHMGHVEAPQKTVAVLCDFVRRAFYGSRMIF